MNLIENRPSDATKPVSEPNGWSRKRIKAVAKIRYGLGQPPQQDDEGLPIIRATNVSEGKITEKDLMFVDPGDLPSGRDPYLKAGEIIVVRSGAYTGDSAIIPERWSGAIAGYDMVVTATRCDAEFLAYCFLSYSVLDAQILLMTLRAAQPHLNANELGSVTFLLPDEPAEQKRIAAYLGASCAAIDRAVETKQKQLDTLDDLRKSIIQHAVTQGLNPDAEMKDSGVDWFGEIPFHWTCESLKRISARTQTGTTPPTSVPEYYEDGTIEWFAPECFGRTIKLGPPKKLINESALRDKKLRLFPGDTVFFVGIGATIGKVALLEESGSANQQIVGIACSHRMLGRFLAYQLKNYEEIIPRIAQFTTMPILNQTKVGYLSILCPPAHEQQDICDYLDAKEAELAKVEETLNSQITTLTAYRKSLIHECVTGKRRITDTDLAKIEAHV